MKRQQVSPNKNRHLSEQWKNKIGLAQIGRYHSVKSNLRCSNNNKGKHEYLRTLKNFNSKPELAVGYILKELHVPFQHQKHISNIKHQYHCDYYLPRSNVILEIDGKWFHELHRNLDKLRDYELRAVGYKLVRIPFDNFEHVIDVLKKFKEI